MQGSLPQVLPGRFEDLGLVAIDRSGEIRQIRDTVLERRLLMKLLRNDLASDDGERERFIAEAKNLARLQHPAIVAVHDAGILRDGRPFFVLPDVRGEPLTRIARDLVHPDDSGRWRRTSAGVSLHRVVGWVHAAALAIAYAHDHGIVHGDLSPEHIRVGAHGEVVVTAWGLAQGLGAPVGGGGREVAGTPAYMAPEQAFAEPRAKAWDVYALGAILYDVLSGHPPFPDPSPHDVLRRLRRGERPLPLQPDNPGGLPNPAPLCQAVRRATSRSATDRHPTVRALADEIAAWLEVPT